MSKDIDSIIKEILQQNKDINGLDSHISKDFILISKDMIVLKKAVKDIDARLKRMDESLQTVLEILKEFTIILGEEEESERSSWSNEDESNTWTPYDIAEEYEEEDNDIEDYSSSLEPDEELEEDL